MTFLLTLPQSPSHNIYPFGTAFCFSLADMKFENMKCRYEIYLLVFNSTSQSFAGPSRELSSQTLEEKFHIYARPRIVRFVISYELRWLQILRCQFFYCFVIFPLLSCWISSANNLIWIFVTFVIAIEVVSFWFGLFKLVILI